MLSTTTTDSLLRRGLMRYADPSQNPIRVIARNAFSSHNIVQAREMLELQLRAEGGSESDVRYLLSIFDGVISAQQDRARRAHPHKFVNTVKPPRTEWIEELDDE